MRQVLIIFLILFLFPVSVFSKDLITISNFEPFESERNPSIEEKITQQIREELLKDNLDVKILKGNIEQSLKESKDLGATLYITGYYRKSNKLPLDMFIQVYSVEKGVIIDANSASFDYESGSGIEYDSKEIETLDANRISEVSKKIPIQLRLNPEKKNQYQGINDNLVNQPISKKIQFKLPDSGRESIKKDTFDIMAGREVETASRSKESIFDAPATILVVTEEEIRSRGYTNLAEIVRDLPGFDVIDNNGSNYVVPYMRGYRTTGGERILFLVDSKPQNELWYQHVVLSRQFPITSIKKIEVLYGPSSVVYGPNASQGIINIITKNGSELKKDGSNATISLQNGDFNTNAIDSTVTGKSGELSYSASVRYFKSDEPDLSKRKLDNFANNYFYANPNYWGPALNYSVNGKKLGKYYDPTTNSGILGSILYRGLKIGIIFYQTKEGFGPTYTGDQTQNNSTWGYDSKTYYAEYEKVVANKFRSFTQVYTREHNITGDWTESYPGETPEEPSLVSSTNWSSINKATGINQILEYQFNKNFKLNSGVNYTSRNLSKQFDVAGYYNVFSSSLPNDPERYPNGFAVVPSTNTELPITPMPSNSQNPLNTASIQDLGGYGQAVLDIDKFRFSAGIRKDQNSVYGKTLNPRVSAIYKYTRMQSLKLVYGEAFQEPTTAQIYGDGGVTLGAAPSPFLKPEKIRSSEIIWILQGKSFFNEINAYYSRYDRVIELDFQSKFGKRIYGLEWKINYYVKNPVPSSDKLSFFFNYTLTESLNSITYNQGGVSGFQNGNTVLGKYESIYTENVFPETQIPLPRAKKYFNSGDIAKNKFNIGINVPLYGKFNINLRGNYIGQRGLYTTNPLREQGYKTDPYFLLNGAFTVNFENYGFFTFRVYNMLNHFYLQPGVEYAAGGNNYTERSLDYRNSILPQPGRYYLMSFTFTF
ncbi:MAG: TonB-dependent receptor [Leptospiraceae bacterium]|nr:TonB-dependent receptor [Leptospiraceae bacterium]